MNFGNDSLKISPYGTKNKNRYIVLVEVYSKAAFLKNTSHRVYLDGKENSCQTFMVALFCILSCVHHVLVGRKVFSYSPS